MNTEIHCHTLNTIRSTTQYSVHHENPNNMVHYTFTVNFNIRAFTGKESTVHDEM
jgi:hypothetical protein